jgi:CheY-like chemotaxis protein
VGKKAFLVDDSKSARIVLSRLLAKNGFDDVVMAESGEQALEILTKETPDAIFVDFLMDGMDGLETIAEIKKQDRFHDTPTVMCTANEGERYEEAAKEHGALGILAKPPTDESLKEIITLIESIKQKAEQAEEALAAGEGGVEAAVEAAEATTQAALPVEELRSLAQDAASQAIQPLLAQVEERAVAAARESVQETVESLLGEVLEKRLASLLDARLEQLQPEQIDVESLQSNVVDQVNQDMEEFVRQVNERTVKDFINGSVHEQVNDLANDFSHRLHEMKSNILSEVPEKNDMIEHIRIITEGSMEAQVREIATQVSQEVSNTVATETVEHILDDHLAKKTAKQSAQDSNKSSSLLIWILLLLAVLGGGVGLYFFGLLG